MPNGMRVIYIQQAVEIIHLSDTEPHFQKILGSLKLVIKTITRTTDLLIPIKYSETTVINFLITNARFPQAIALKISLNFTTENATICAPIVSA